MGAVSGDARRALDICRRAVEIFEMQLEESKTPSKNQGRLIGMSHIEQAVMEMFSSPSVQAILRSRFHPRVFLVSVLRLVRSQGIAEVEFGNVT